MFGRDNKQFRFPGCEYRMMEPHPHREPHPPPPPEGRHHFGPFPPFPPPPGRHFPINRNAFSDLRKLVILSIIADYNEGVTGYQLQDKYDFPRGTLIRTLTDFQEKGYLTSKEEIIEGRANKFYFITVTGKKKLENLKRKWAGHFAMMSEKFPQEKYARRFFKDGLKHFLSDRIEAFSSVEDAEDFFRGIRSNIKGMLDGIKIKQKNLEVIQEEVNMILNTINEMNDLEHEKLKELVMAAFENINSIEEKEKKKQ